MQTLLSFLSVAIRRDHLKFAVLPLIVFLFLCVIHPPAERGGLDGFVYVAAFVYGIYRPSVFHPALITQYKEFLSNSNWSGSKKLPFGPVTFSLYDFPAMLVLLFTAKLSQAHLGALFLSLISGYTVFACICLLRMQLFHKLLVYLSGITLLLHTRFLLSEYKLTTSIHVLDAAQMILLLIIATHMLQLSVTTLANPAKTDSEEIKLLRNKERAASGWPLLAITPRQEVPRISYRTSLIYAALLAYITLALLQFSDISPVINPYGLKFSMEAILLWLVGISILRVVVYHRFDPGNPLSLLGRLCQGRIIIPSYDAILVGPFFIVATGFILILVGRAVSLPGPCSIFLFLFSTLYVAFTTGPSIEKWHYCATRARHFPAAELHNIKKAERGGDTSSFFRAPLLLVGGSLAVIAILCTLR